MDDACILCVDDETGILQALKRLLRREPYRTLTANSADEALNILEKEKIHVIISDQRMPGMDGTELFSRVRKKWPQIIRIILSGYTDIDTIAEAVNRGHIYKFILKPWNDQNLRLEIRQALDQYALAETNRRLQETIVEQNEALKNSNEGLEKAVAERTHELKVQNHALELSRAVLETLPFPVLGISSEGLVAVANQSAMDVFNKKNGFGPGAEASDFFDKNVLEAIGMVMKKNETRRLTILPEQISLTITPLTGRFQGAGAVLVFSPQASGK
ncbi:response regulator receiver domain-containing protein [Desulfobotulus alkaliphilus]|uniref:Response regulator receiver domain-containing protein n=1 Tax=Desulfobotulus alkaliphilus TaxID=622671 RepID=A0A562S620_9BACT|nr:response regulator [Desulfobotulus alkaliphilus]TWI76801.1 response regulator receiver domain-containing protein [Desulfobotulus alkaliphilus]